MKLSNRIHTIMKPRLTLNVPLFARAALVLGRTLLVIGCGLVLSTVLPRAQAAPPEAMTYQGFLVDGNGNPLATNNPANYPVIFRIFSASAGGTSLWSEQQIVTVDKGNFSVILSEGTAVGGEPKPLLSVVMGTNGVDRYIQISVTIAGSTTDMLPRMRLLPSPYAFLSTSANQLVNPSGAAVVTYANSRVEVAGNLFASGTISGNGSGLTLTPGQIPNIDAAKITSGTLLDARLSANVALLSSDAGFLGDLTTVGNIGIGTPNTTFPLTIGNQVPGDKISLWGQSGNSYGFGIGSGLLQIHSSDVTSDISFGYGSSAAMTENMRIKGNGNVGIGTNNPTARLEVNGGVKITGANALEFGAGVAGKEPNAGKIGYGAFTPNTLDIVGAGTTAANRKVKITAEGGTDFTGPISVNGQPPFHFGVASKTYGAGFNGADSQSTGLSSSQYHVVVVGADCRAGEIYQARAIAQGGVWVINAYIRGNVNNDFLVWRVMYMRVPNALVTTNSFVPITVSP
jgi:hypothetical protein